MNGQPFYRGVSTVIFCCTAALGVTAMADISISKGTEIIRTDYPYPRSLSGITYAGGDKYYMVADDASNGENAANARFFRVEAQRVRSGEAK